MTPSVRQCIGMVQSVNTVFGQPGAIRIADENGEATEYTASFPVCCLASKMIGKMARYCVASAARERIVWIKDPGDPVGLKDPDERLKHIHDKWSEALKRLAKGVE